MWTNFRIVSNTQLLAKQEEKQEERGSCQTLWAKKLNGRNNEKMDLYVINNIYVCHLIF